MADRTRTLNLDRDGRNWPNRETSRIVTAAGIDWHVQRLGQGPPVLLVHGTGASTHSWSWLAPRLKDRFSLILVDLPSHAFTSTVPAYRMTLPGVAAALGDLLTAMAIAPALAIGHSAGAAILTRMALDGLTTPPLIVSINGALMPFPGAAAHIFPAMAKVLFLNPFTPRFFAWRAGQGGAVDRLIEGTGSDIPPRSLDLYRRLFQSPGHVAGALAMMANWDLARLIRDLPKLQTNLVQIVGSNDRAIPPDQAYQVAKCVPRAEVELLRGLGHLAHEEDPDRVARAIVKAAANMGMVEELL